MLLAVVWRVVVAAVSYTHLRAHETGRNLVCRLLLEKKKKEKKEKFPTLTEAFLIRVAESNRSFYIFLSRKVLSAATPPRALQ